MNPYSEEARYLKYMAYCRILGTEPLDLHSWRREAAKIPELQ
jgi:hypothetical protein